MKTTKNAHFAHALPSVAFLEDRTQDEMTWLWVTLMLAIWIVVFSVGVVVGTVLVFFLMLVPNRSGKTFSTVSFFELR